MPGGVPVATVAVDGAKNAGLLAVQMLGIGDKSLRDKMLKYKAELTDMVMQKVEKLKNR